MELSLMKGETMPLPQFDILSGEFSRPPFCSEPQIWNPLSEF
jgi:hypothetical protein